MNQIDKYYNEFLPILLNGDRRGCTQQVMNMLENGISIKEIYLGVFQRSLTDIGTMWQKNHITVADEHLCTAIIQSIIIKLKI